MKKTLLGLITLATISFGFVNNANAQDNQGERRTRQTERLVKNLKLSDEQKAKFEEVYNRYQGELAQLFTQRQQADNQTSNAKDMTEAEATARLQAIFTQQEEQIQRSQMRLDIQKKYCAEFSAFLTPQQLVQLFEYNPMRNRGGDQQGNRGPRGNRGGFGGGSRGGFGGGRGGFGGPGGDF